MTYGQRARVALVGTVLELGAAVAQGQPADQMGAAIAVLQSDADTLAQAKACQQLAALGRPEAVPALAGLLADGKLNAQRAVARELKW